MRSATLGLLRGGGLVLGGFLLVVALILVLGNGAVDDPVDDAVSGDATLACRVLTPAAPLPTEAHESSGLAPGIRNPEVFWTHNDSGDDPRLYAFGEGGRLAGAVEVTGASARDWEDLESAPCPDGDDGACLYIADTGDNDADRDHVALYIVREPEPGDAAAAATAIRARYPDGARDAEGLFVVDGRPYLMSKGREGPIRLYRFPDPQPGEEVITLEPVTEIAARPGTTADYVTAATATPDGRWVAFRTYRELLVTEASPLVAGEAGAIRRFDLTPLGEVQGEAVVMDDDGTVWLTSEARDGRGPSWSRLVCDL